MVSELNKPFTLTEVKSAILSLQSRNCPGLDSFPFEFYKGFLEKLSTLLFKEAYDFGVLSLTMQQAVISCYVWR